MEIQALESMRQGLILKKPVVVHYTNYVTMDFVANCLLALGAAPLMSEAQEESLELLAISSAIVVNIGTLTPDFLTKLAPILANNITTPLVLDPVGSGATVLRTQAAYKLLPYATVVRGNGSEILSLAPIQEELSFLAQSQGVESMIESTNALNAGRRLVAHRENLTCVVTGKTDYVLAKHKELSLNFGSVLMKRVTGMGCALTSVIAAFCATSNNAFEAAEAATLYFTLCGEQAAAKASGPGSFRTQFIDALYQPDFSLMKERYAHRKSDY